MFKLKSSSSYSID